MTHGPKLGVNAFYKKQFLSAFFNINEVTGSLDTDQILDNVNNLLCNVR